LFVDVAFAAECRRWKCTVFNWGHRELTESPTEEEWKARRAGLVWIGEQHYPEPEDFLEESRAMGISRRINSIPHGFVVGETWVLLAHIRAVQPTAEEMAQYIGNGGGEKPKAKPGIFSAFMPDRVEQVVTPDEAEDDEFIEKLEKRGITPVMVKRDCDGVVVGSKEDS
jgi:hypothetical protein